MKCENLYKIMKKNDLGFYAGVPDSTFKGWMSFLEDKNGKGLTNIIAVNECEAVAITSGYHLATGKTGVVYMQNSGEGKTVNPLTSLCDPEVYSIPVILMIGWRGEPGQKDEPQHKKMGRITLSLLDTLEIPYMVFPDKMKEAEKAVSRAKKTAEKRKGPVAIIIKKGVLEEYKTKKTSRASYEMKREDAIKAVVDNLGGSEIIVSTTGKTSRELFEYRAARGEKPRDFYTVGSMGCAVSIGMGIALLKKNKEVVVFDGDGAVLMQMGALATVGNRKPKNFYHIVFDNESHDSTGGQPTSSGAVHFEKIALDCGYKSAEKVETKNGLIKAMKKLKKSEGPLMVVIKVSKGSRKGLGRPTSSPIENKEIFMEFVKAKNASD